MSMHLLGGGTGGSGARRLTRAAAALALVALGVAGIWSGTLFELSNGSIGAVSGIAWIALAILYILLFALPFVPAIEVGLAIMLLFGKDGVFMVYLCTQIALVLGFAGGRMLPTSALAARFDRLLLQRAAVLRACHQRALEHPCLALAAALNLPGNAAVGGAGGIALIAGASRLFSFPRYCLTVAVATSPVPLTLLLSGWV
jgi:hypothetical protein